jgi:hypothetical protein
LNSTDKPLWAYAHVRYQLDEPVTGAGYYYRVYSTETYNLSSLMQVASPEELKAAGVQPTMKPSLMIETFDGDWEKDWFSYKPDKWELKTHKIYCDTWKAPKNANLVFEIRCAAANKLVVSIDKFAREIELEGGNEWQQIVLSANDFKNENGEQLADWSEIREFTFSASESFKIKADGEYEKTILGGEWKGDLPEFRKLMWLIK